ncbi:hypothetical protein [Deinococcus petrolearius]|uniref:MazG nucleotide pyrophosphohydrolase n=1 Tax=Deinococcus petrolearius TaxID=1751295 RepID=A0ABW1DFY2_9DEIO
MQTIEEQARALLNPVLGECVRQRTEAGVRKYGQTLDENEQPQREKAIHLIQELLDACQYALWMGHEYTATLCATIASDTQQTFKLTAEEIMAGGKQ